MNRSPEDYKPKPWLLEAEDEILFPLKIELPISVSKSKIDKKEEKYLEPKDLELESKFASLIIQKSIVSNPSDKFQSFLCDIELFNWEKESKNYEKIEWVTHKFFYNVFIKHICKILGNDLTLFSAQYYDKDYNVPYVKDNLIVSRPINDEMKNYEDKENLDIINVRINLNLPYEFIYFPLFFYEINRTWSYDKPYDTAYNVYYTEEITKVKTRYSLIPTIIDYLDERHFVFVFVDHESKNVEFYDPHGSSIDRTTREFIYSSLNIIFKGYKVNEFWDMSGIQGVESATDEEGFCVIWGNLMIHLKLLNINKSMKEIEYLFIKECAQKQLSLFEIMLNYAYYMTRILNQNYEKTLKFENSLNTGN